jgi:outer membrane receptor protein involved in Fe transport
MNRRVGKWLLHSSATALLSAVAASMAAAQEQAAPQQAGGVEEVVVSASRISIAGYNAPTPVTVVGAAQLAAEAKPDLGDTIREIPAVQGASPQAGSSAVVISGAPAGQSQVYLRDLGVLRTLVLIDSQRVVQSNITGGVDLNTIPSTLIQRVDIVTGGASAAWGSDAVAGVINLIVNKNFSGFKANGEFSDNSQNTYKGMKLEASYGTDFDGDRGHFIVSGAFQYSPNWYYTYQAPWYNKVQLVPNPAYNATTNPNVPQLIHQGNIGEATATQGGIIVSNPKGTTANSANLLRGIDFIGPNAVPTPVNLGNLVGPAAYGGDLGFYDSQTPMDPVAIPSRQTTFFTYGSYKLSDTVRASIQLNYGRDWAQDTGTAAQNLGNLTIQSDNAYIPALVKATMAANGITSFVMGTTNMNNIDIRHITAAAAAQTLGIPINNNYRQQMRGVVTLDGTLGDGWSWNAFAQHGETKVALRVFANSLLARIPLASDAVVVTASNVGTSGLQIGSIACRSTLTSPTNECQPLDVFGTGNASRQAIDWIDSADNPDREDITLNEDDFSGSLQGVLPWQLPAGPVAVATGAEYRHETGRIYTDSRGATAQWGSGNFANFQGGYSVEEGFPELDAPILKDSFVESLDFNSAGRITNYSTSGVVETWKLGATSQIVDDLRLRTVWSTDIRAPNLSELFTAHQINTGAQIDLNSPSCTSTTLNQYGFPNSIAGCTSPFVASDRSGNTNLVPEVGHTITAGVVFTPDFLPGALLAVDWYNISIDQSIVTLTGNPTNCAAARAAQYCTLLEFSGPVYSNGKRQLTVLHGLPVNAASERVSGFDVQADYGFPFWNGTLSLALKTTYIDEHTIINVGVTCDQIG